MDLQPTPKLVTGFYCNQAVRGSERRMLRPPTARGCQACRQTALGRSDIGSHEPEIGMD